MARKSLQASLHVDSEQGRESLPGRPLSERHLGCRPEGWQGRSLLLAALPGNLLPIYCAAILKLESLADPRRQEIALLSSDWKVFTLLLSDDLKRSFPSELTNAYLVGEKVFSIIRSMEMERKHNFGFVKVGSGTTAEVRLCYRHPDLSRFTVKLVNKTDEWDSKYSMPCDFRREVEVLDKVDRLAFGHCDGVCCWRRAF